ncbi:MAG TPA: signal peptidase I [Armatimonadota bacterium]|nr:signal peptidase I [Armatimonadota bacterium]
MANLNMELLPSHPKTNREYERHERVMEQRRREWVLLGAILCAVLLFGLNFRVVKVEGSSMDPTYHDRDTLLLWKTADLARPYRVGDVIVFQSSDGDELIKRIAFIQNREGTARMPEKLWTPTRPMPPRILCLLGNTTSFPGYNQDIEAAKRGVPVRRTIYVMGDNTWNSDDSRDFGPISPDQILGVIVCRVSSSAGSEIVDARTARGTGRRA